MMVNVCTNCVENESLKTFILQNGKNVKTCNICKRNEVNAINGYDESFKHAIRALIRCNYDQRDYVGEEGEKDLVDFLLERKPLFSRDFYSDKEQSLEILRSISLDYKCDPSEGVSLLCNNDNPSNMFWSVEGSTNRNLHDIEWLIRDQYYLDAIKSIKDIVSDSLTYIQRNISDLQLYRARIGFEECNWISYEGDVDAILEYRPFSKSKIGSPPSHLAKKGRMNREGFSFLYMSEDQNTAVIEVRPSPSDVVSIGKFRQIKPCKIIDLYNIDISSYWRCDNDLEIYYKLYQLSNYIAQPTGSTGDYKYTYTQLIAEELLSLGYEGVRFKSSFTGMANYTIFSPNLFEYIQKDFAAVEITNIEIRTRELDVVKSI